MKFYQKFLRHEVEPEDILEYVNTWHNSSTEEDIYDFLGLTEKEYEIFIRYPEKAETLRKGNQIKYSASTIVKALRKVIKD